MQDTQTTTASGNTAGVDTNFTPPSYWGAEAHPKRVEIASVNWNGNRTYYLDALHHKDEIAFRWRVDGDHGDLPENPEPLTGPMALGDLMDTLEENCLAASSLEEAWDMAWTAAQENVDYSDADAVEYALDEVSEAYTFTSDLYPTLSDLYDERFQAWRDQQDVSVE